MEVFILTLLIFAISVTGLSIGVILKGKQIKGHCGGATLDDGCGGDCNVNGADSCIEACADCSCEPEGI